MYALYIKLFVFYRLLLLSGLSRVSFCSQRPSGQDVVVGVIPSPPTVRTFMFIAMVIAMFIAQRGFSIHPTVQLFTLVDFDRVLQTHALAFSYNNEKIPSSTNMHSGRFEPTILTVAGIIFTTTPQGTAGYWASIGF